MAVFWLSFLSAIPAIQPSTLRTSTTGCTITRGMTFPPLPASPRSLSSYPRRWPPTLPPTPRAFYPSIGGSAFTMWIPTSMAHSTSPSAAAVNHVSSHVHLSCFHDVVPLPALANLVSAASAQPHPFPLYFNSWACFGFGALGFGPSFGSQQPSYPQTFFYKE